MYLTGSPFNYLLTQTTLENKLNTAFLFFFNCFFFFFRCCSVALWHCRNGCSNTNNLSWLLSLLFRQRKDFVEHVQLLLVTTSVKYKRQSSQLVFVLDPPTQPTNSQSESWTGLDVRISSCRLHPTNRAVVRRWAASHQRNTWKTVGETKHRAALLFFFVPFWHGGDDARLAGQRVSVYLQVRATPTTSLPTCRPPCQLAPRPPSGRGSCNTPTGQWSLLWPSADLMWFHSRAAIARRNVPSGLWGTERALVKLCVADRGLCQVREIISGEEERKKKKHKNTHVENQTPGPSPSLSQFFILFRTQRWPAPSPTHSCVSAVNAGITVVE